MVLNQSRKEFNKSKKYLKQLNETFSLLDYEENWMHFLSSLEKVWDKVQAECAGIHNTFKPWRGKYEKDRKIDPVLKYLKNARNADNHSIQEITEITPHTTKINLLGGSGHIDRMVTINGKVTEYRGDPIKIVYSPGKVEIKPFTNRQLIYNIPEYHKGKKLKNSKNPIELGEIAIEYYENFLNDVEEKF